MPVYPRAKWIPEKVLTVVIVLAPPEVNLWTGILFGGWGATLLGGGAIQPIVHSKAGCLLHTALPMDGEGDIWHTTGPNH